VACDAEVRPLPDLDPALAALLADLSEATGLPPAAPYREYRTVCDGLGATSALVPVAWTDEIPGPDAPPQPTVTVGPDLTSRVEEQPVVGVGAARFVGDPPAASFVNDNNAAGSLENGARTLPRVGDSVADGCVAMDPVPYEVDGYAGAVQPYRDCDGEARAWLAAAAFPDDGGEYQTQLIGQALTTADLEALVRAIDSLRAEADHVPARDLPPLPTLEAGA
jgi:hypothetical protein